MVIYVLYFIVIILSNTVGAISGMGGGVIIKPILDAIDYHSLVAITFYSSVAVFTMSISSTYKQIKNGVRIRWPQSISISIGSIIGGIMGNKLFSALLTFFGEEKNVQLIQIVLTILSLVLVFIYTVANKATLHLTSIGIYFSVGLFLGAFSTLLGIGGGPINVCLLIWCFGLTMRDATVYSIITIFFSQLAKLSEIAFSTGFGAYDLRILWVIIPAALLGGYLGGVMSGKLTNKMIGRAFLVIVLLVIGLNIMNGLQILFT